jgi:hypothetical protein
MLNQFVPVEVAADVVALLSFAAGANLGVEVETNGMVVAALSFAGAMTFTMRDGEAVRPFGSVTV